MNSRIRGFDVLHSKFPSYAPINVSLHALPTGNLGGTVHEDLTQANVKFPSLGGVKRGLTINSPPLGEILDARKVSIIIGVIISTPPPPPPNPTSDWPKAGGKQTIEILVLLYTSLTAILWAMIYEQPIETAIEKSRAHHQLEPELLNYEGKIQGLNTLSAPL